MSDFNTSIHAKSFDLASDGAAAIWDVTAAKAAWIHLRMLRHHGKSVFDRGPKGKKDWSKAEKLTFSLFFANNGNDIAWEALERKNRGFVAKTSRTKYEQCRRAANLPVIPFNHFIARTFEDPVIANTKKPTDVLREAIHMSTHNLSVETVQELRRYRNAGRCYYIYSEYWDMVPYWGWKDEKEAALAKNPALALAEDPRERIYVHDAEIQKLIGTDAQGRILHITPKQARAHKARAKELALEFDALPELKAERAILRDVALRGLHPAVKAGGMETSAQKEEWLKCCRNVEDKYKPKGSPVTSLRISGHIRLLAIAYLIEKQLWIPDYDWVDEQAVA